MLGKSFLIAGGLLLALASQRAAAAPLSLREALSYALTHSPLIDSATRRVEISELDKGRARSRFLPALDVGATFGIEGSDPQASVTHPVASRLSLALTENLFDSGQSITRFRLSNIALDRADLARLKTRDELILEVASLYYRHSLAKALSEVKHQQLDLLGAQLKAATSRYKQGMKTRKDYLRFKTQVQRAEIEAANADIAIQRISLSLRRALGASHEPLAEPLEFASLELPEKIPDVPSAPPASDRSYEVRLAKVQLKTAPLNVQLANQEYWPQLFVTAGASYGDFGFLGPNRNSFGANRNFGWNALIGLKYNLWDWDLRSNGVEIEKRNQSIAENDLRQATLTVTAETRSLTLELSRLHANSRLSRTLLETEQDTYDFIRREYEEGKVPYLDLVTSLSALLDARVMTMTAHFELAEALARYRYYEGTLHETLSL